jgi:pimeloyl-ACP methyl ester carboxylesterase
VTRRFDHDGVELAFMEQGQGRPILLIHGFASNHQVNWVGTGWVDTLARAGHRVVALDNRGHGLSTKLYDPADYHTLRMAEDALALLDHLGIEHAAVMGYSMGARIAAHIALMASSRLSALILGGLGIHLVDGAGLPTTIAAAMEAPSLADVADPMGRTFRAFADQTGADKAALAACIRGSRQTLSREEVGSIRVPTLIAVGTRDRIAGSAHDLAALMPNAVALDIPDKDHNPAVGDRHFKAGALAFLSTHEAGA